MPSALPLCHCTFCPTGSALSFRFREGYRPSDLQLTAAEDPPATRGKRGARGSSGVVVPGPTWDQPRNKLANGGHLPTALEPEAFLRPRSQPTKLLFHSKSWEPMIWDRRVDRGDSFPVFKHLVCNTQEPILADSLLAGAQGVFKTLQLLGRAWPGSRHPVPPQGSPATAHGKSAQGALDATAISSYS